MINKETDAALPWEKSSDRVGYTKLDMSINLGELGVVDVRRQKPSEPNPGNFAVYHAGQRISDRSFATRPEAIAEAERHLYSLPDFINSKPAQMIRAAVETGRQSFHDGIGIYANPFGPDRPVSRIQWAEGWLHAYGNEVATRALQATQATLQANNQLEADLSHTFAKLRAMTMILGFAINIKNDAALRRFLNLANDGDLDTIRGGYAVLLPPVGEEPT